MTRIFVYKMHPCPRCHADEQFATKVALEDYSEMHDLKPCTKCGYVLSQEDEQNLTDEAWYSSIEDFYDQRADALAERRSDR